MEWTSVKDKLPNNNERVLAQCDGVIRIMIFKDFGVGIEWWCGITEWARRNNDDVTHWISLPKPPVNGGAT